MPNSRTQNTKRNLLWGTISNCISIFVPFLTKTTIIHVMGVEYEGLNGVFSSILQVLSFAEMGIGSALVYSMYSPIAKGEDSKVRALLNMYRKCYRVIGLTVLIIGLLLLPFLNVLVKKDLPDGINIYLLFGIYLLNNVLSYWVFAEKNSLLLACQRDDINSRVSIIVKLILNISQIIVIMCFKNYYGFVIAIPVFTVLQNLTSAHMVSKLYPQYYCEGIVEKSELNAIKRNVGGMFFQKIGNIVLSSVDPIVISAYLGLTILGIYNGYHYVITALFGFSAVISRALIPSAGNSIASASLKKNYNDFEKFHFIYQWIIVWWSSCFLCLIQPFIKLWLGEELMLSNGMAILFTLYFFFYKWFDIVYVYREASGIWWEGKWFPIIAALFNLVTNIILVQIIGLSGVLLSTILSLIIIHDTVGVYILKKHYFKNVLDLKAFYLKQVRTLLCGVICCGCSYTMANVIPYQNTMIIIILRGIICLIIPNLIMYLILRKTKVFIESKEFIINKVIHKRDKGEI